MRLSPKSGQRVPACVLGEVGKFTVESLVHVAPVRWRGSIIEPEMMLAFRERTYVVVPRGT